VPGRVHTIAQNVASDRYWYLTPPVGTLHRFYMVGTQIYPDPTQVVTGYQAGRYHPTTHTITWFHGEAEWNLQTTPQADTTLPLTSRLRGRPEQNKYVLDYSAYLPAGASLN